MKKSIAFPGYVKEKWQSKPIEEKKIFRWLNAMRKTWKRAQKRLPILTVYSKESGSYESFSEMATLDEGVLVLAVQNRMEDNGKPDYLLPISAN